MSAINSQPHHSLPKLIFSDGSSSRMIFDSDDSNMNSMISNVSTFNCILNTFLASGGATESAVVWDKCTSDQLMPNPGQCVLAEKLDVSDIEKYYKSTANELDGIICTCNDSHGCNQPPSEYRRRLLPPFGEGRQG